MKAENIIKKRVLLLDGALGTNLYERGMPHNAVPEDWCLKNSKILESLQRDYVKAGSDVIYTATFGANRIKLNRTKNNVVLINRKLAQISRKAAGNRVLVAGDIGPTGRFIKPFGDLDFEDAVDLFKEQVKGLLLGGVDIFAIETMIDIQEARAALLAVRELSDKFTMVTMSYEKDGRTLNGTDPLSALITLQSLGADAVGSNCSRGPYEMTKILSGLKRYSKVPLVAKPNAGLPKIKEGRAVFDMTESNFARYAKDLVLEGVNIIGGCCGTKPAHIAALKKQLRYLKPKKVSPVSCSIISSARGYLDLNSSKDVIFIGEKINPTGKKLLQSEIRRYKFSRVKSLAKEQEYSGAKALDVNISLAGIDEKKAMLSAMSELSVSTNLPLAIDSSSTHVIEAALRFYPGRALVNSLTAEPKKMKELMPVIKKYGPMVIFLPVTAKGIPDNFQERKKVIDKNLKMLNSCGILKADIVIDPITLAVSCNMSSAVNTLKTIAYCKSKLNMSTVIGLSNISFGLPKRDIVNKTFLDMAKSRGLKLAILDPARINSSRPSRHAKDLLLGQDKNGIKFIKYYSKKEHRPVLVKADILNPKDNIGSAIIDADRDNIKDLINNALNSGISASSIMNEALIPAITKVGELFEKKAIFLPQLIASSETMKKAVSQITPVLKKDGFKGKSKALVIMATVEGDIHDIGKNIVSLILSNHGFEVIDLGKDVTAQSIIKAAREYQPDVVGLSALMTTTMVNMKRVIELAVSEGLNCKFLIGGAVVDEAYADSLGVNYAKDGIDAVKIINRIVV
ncbi:MAG: homocysteine S-methyltransferase family protein [Candidatus Omnitrophica bacterium]|nr:homocysteine S-methyltransferase family protein [Candidatus Omnitrophota bacterium]